MSDIISPTLAKQMQQQAQVEAQQGAIESNEIPVPIDPKTGRPAQTLVSQTVAAKNPVGVYTGVPATKPEIQLATPAAKSNITPSVGSAPKTVTPVKAPAVQAQPTDVSPAMEAQPINPVVASGQAAAMAEPQVPEVAKDPVKAAGSQPGFWTQLLDVSKNTGRNILELLGDFAAGYSHQQSSPTEQRLAREHDLRMQGNALQAQRDLINMNQSFQGQQSALDRALQEKLATDRTDVEKQKLQQQHDYQTQQLALEKIRVQNEYMINMFNAQWQRQAFQWTHTNPNPGAQRYGFGETK